MRPLLPLLLVLVCACGRTAPERAALPPAPDPSPPLNAWDAGQDPAADAGAHPDAGLIGDIQFEDVHFVTGTPRKLNANRREATDVGNEVRLWVEPSRADISLDWRTDLGELDAPRGASVRFRSSAPGTAHVTVTASLPTGEALVRETAVEVTRPHRLRPILHGQWVAFERIAPSEVQVVSTVTREEVSLGSGTLLGFDGETVAVRPLRHGDRTLRLWRVGDWTQQSLAPPAIQGSWDYRGLGLSQGRLYYVTADASYQQNTLYSVSLATGAEQRHYGPMGLRGSAAWDGRLVFSEATAPQYAFRSWLLGGGTAVQPLPFVGVTQVVRSWAERHVALLSTTGYAIVDRTTGASVDVPSRLGSVTSVVLSPTHVGGHDRDPWGTRGAVFLDALDGSTRWRHELDDNDFADPSIDGRRLAWAHGGAVWLAEAP